jgi:hypothetical protein
VLTADYGRHMDILQDLQLKLLEMLEHEGISLAQNVQQLRFDRPLEVETELKQAGHSDRAQGGGEPSAEGRTQ